MNRGSGFILPLKWTMTFILVVFTFYQLHISSFGSSLSSSLAVMGKEDTIIKHSSKIPQEATLPPCSDAPLSLVGRAKVDNLTKITLEELKSRISGMDNGEWKPHDCKARSHVVIIIPFRDRMPQLTILLKHIIPFMKRQQLHFRIFVVEQSGFDYFNKGRVMNAGFLEATKVFPAPCVIFHDVDMLPEDDRNTYNCSAKGVPKHLSPATNTLDYRLIYTLLVGGVLAIPTKTYIKLNGYSNVYWAWGGEDDDMAYRIHNTGLKVERPPAEIGRFTMVKHNKAHKSNYARRLQLMREGKERQQQDGVNNVNYTVISTINEKLYTHILVHVGKSNLIVS